MLNPTPNWSTERILPHGFLPMLPTNATGPLDSAEHAYEIRWEGQRVLVGLEGPSLFARTPGGQDVARWFPELTAVRTAVEPLWALLDAEWVIADGERASSERMRERLRRSAPPPGAGGEGPPAVLVVSDILRIGDSWLLDLPWSDRREILHRAVKPGGPVRLTPVYGTGATAAREAARLSEGEVLAKRRRGRYVPAHRTREWLAIRPAEETDAVLCGWAVEGRERKTALLLAVRTGDRLRYAGKIDAAPASLLGAVRAQTPATGPITMPRGAAAPSQPFWVEPGLDCRVRYHGTTGSGLLRHAEVVSVAGAPALSESPP